MTHMKIRFKEMHEILNFVNTVSQCDCVADIKCGHTILDAKSLIGVISIASEKEVELILHTNQIHPSLSSKLAAFAA